MKFLLMDDIVCFGNKFYVEIYRVVRVMIKYGFYGVGIVYIVKKLWFVFVFIDFDN